MLPFWLAYTPIALMIEKYRKNRKDKVRDSDPYGRVKSDKYYLLNDITPKEQSARSLIFDLRDRKGFTREAVKKRFTINPHFGYYEFESEEEIDQAIEKYWHSKAH